MDRKNFTIRLDTQTEGKGNTGRYRIWHGERVVDHATSPEHAATKVAAMLALGLTNVSVTD